MNLCELLQKTKYDQKFYCYVTNCYGQNLPIGSGTRIELLHEEINDELFWHLLDEVDSITVARDGALLIRTKDNHYDERLEEQYEDRYTKHWDKLDPSSRPYKFCMEMEDWGCEP